MSVEERLARSVALEQAYVHDVYEQFYDNPRSKPWLKVQQFLQNLEPGSLVCDVGCGNGKYLNVNTSVFNMGGDKSMRLTEVAREKENEVIVLDNLALPYRDESLDAVVSIAVVHHLATTDRRICAIRELARVLRIGGRLIITVWAMEQSHRKFESQDVLVPWHRPELLSTPSLELTSTTTTSEDDCCQHPYHAYTQTSDSDSNRSPKSKNMAKKRGKNRHKGRSIDPSKNSSPSSSSLSSPNETCYSFVRRALQKLAGGRRVGVHKPWFLDSWSACTKEPPRQRYNNYEPCDCCDCIENIHDIPIELRRVDDEDMLPQRRQTFPSSQLLNDICSNLKSRSMTNIKTVENNNVIRSRSSTPSVTEVHLVVPEQQLQQTQQVKPPKATLAKPKPKLVKQKKSICEDDDEEALDQPTDMKSLINNLPDFKVFHSRYHRGTVLKQRSLNEELMSTDRLKEKERVRQNIQKQASLNEDLIYQRHHTFDSFKDSFFSVSTSKRFQLIKTGFTNKIKNSTTNIEKVTGTSLRNGFVRMFQNWKSSDLISPIIPEDEAIDPAKMNPTEDKREDGNGPVTERRHSKEDGSDSSKDSSLQSDTSVDSEDSFASVIFVPKSDPMSPTPLSPGPISPRLRNSSVPNSPRIKQSSCPTSPRIKQMPLTLYPLTKQLSSPKPTTADILPDKSERDHSNTESTTQANSKTLAQKYSVPQIPKFRKTSLNSSSVNTSSVNTTSTTTTTTTITTTSASPEKSPVEKAETRNERLKKIKELLTQKPGFGVRSIRSTNYPIVRHTKVTNGKLEVIAKPLPKLLSLELFNPEIDDKDSDSSCVSSPDSVDSVINMRTADDDGKYSNSKTKFKFPPPMREAIRVKDGKSMSLLEAAADVANSLDEAVEKVIKSSPRAKRKLQSGEVLSVIQRRYSTDTTPLLSEDGEPSWDEDCHKHLTDFADRLSEKLMQEINHYQEKSKERSPVTSTSMDNIDDPYIHRLSEELDDLSKLSAEIQKQNEYLAQLSASDNLFNRQCRKCKIVDCRCYDRTKAKNRAETIQTDTKKVPASDYYSAKGEIFKKSHTNDSLNNVELKNEAKQLDTDGNLTSISKLSVSKTSIKMGTSTDSCDSEKGSSTNSMISSAATSLNFGPSMESQEDVISDKLSNEESQSQSHKDTNSTISRYSDGGGSTASLASCPEWKNIKSQSQLKTDLPSTCTATGGRVGGKLTKDSSSFSLESDSSSRRKHQDHNDSSRSQQTLFSDTSQESLPSDNVGGEITYHRYYHVFREGELDQLIEKYVENLHIISSYYDHASWCIIAEKVQVWTI